MGIFRSNIITNPRYNPAHRHQRRNWHAEISRSSAHLKRESRRQRRSLNSQLFPRRLDFPGARAAGEKARPSFIRIAHTYILTRFDYTRVTRSRPDNRSFLLGFFFFAGCARGESLPAGRVCLQHGGDAVSASEVCGNFWACADAEYWWCGFAR